MGRLPPTEGFRLSGTLGLATGSLTRGAPREDSTAATVFSDSLGVTGLTGDLDGDFGVLEMTGEARGLAKLGRAVNRFLLCGPDVKDVLVAAWESVLLDAAPLL